MSSKKKPIEWYKRKEFWGGLGLAAAGLTQFEDYTIAFQVGEFIEYSIPVLLSILGVKQGIKAKNVKLPKGIRKSHEKKL